MDKSNWRNEQGNYITRGLVKEFVVHEDLAVFTIQPDDITDENGRKYLSLRKIYLELEDPTEYKIASEYFLGWKHWKKFCDTSVVKPYLEEWREELEAKLRCKGVQGVAEKAYTGDYQASKWLADKGWIPSSDKKRGAPTKAEKERELKVAAKMGSIIDLDYNRLMKK